jgi:hypothetical protein
VTCRTFWTALVVTRRIVEDSPRRATAVRSRSSAGLGDFAERGPVAVDVDHLASGPITNAAISAVDR